MIQAAITPLGEGFFRWTVVCDGTLAFGNEANIEHARDKAWWVIAQRIRGKREAAGA